MEGPTTGEKLQEVERSIKLLKDQLKLLQQQRKQLEKQLKSDR